MGAEDKDQALNGTYNREEESNADDEVEGESSNSSLREDAGRDHQEEERENCLPPV